VLSELPSRNTTHVIDPSGATLLRLYTACTVRIRSLEHIFNLLCERHGEKLVSKWEAIDITPKKVDGVWFSVYEAKVGDGMSFSISQQCPEV
jgi:hypothetical protein